MEFISLKSVKYSVYLLYVARDLTLSYFCSLLKKTCLHAYRMNVRVYNIIVFLMNINQLIVVTKKHRVFSAVETNQHTNVTRTVGAGNPSVSAVRTQRFREIGLDCVDWIRLAQGRVCGWLS
jgi:hypothetical protein